MSSIESVRGFQQARNELEEASRRLEEKRKSLEGKTRILEEKARVEKLAIDRKLLLQIVEEENLTHNAAIKDLEEKIASVDLQIKPSVGKENISDQKTAERAKETPETPEPVQQLPVQQVPDESVQETSNAVDAPQERSFGPLQESEVSPGTSKKKKRGLF